MAVNSYRFIAMYLFIGMIIGTITAISQDTTSTVGGFDLESGRRIEEISTTGIEIYEDSESLVQANQFDLSNSYGDERALGRNWVEIFKNGFLPTGFIPESQLSSTNEMDKNLNQLIKWFRWIILLFAGYELFQMILRKVS